MTQETVSFVNSNNSSNYIMSIRLMADGFSFYLSQKDGSDIHVFVYETDEELSMLDNLKRMLERFDYFFSLEYDRVYVVWGDSNVSFMPFVLFDDEDAELVFCQNQVLRDGYSVAYNILARSGAVALFDIENVLCGVLETRFGSRLKHLAPVSQMIERLSAVSRELPGRNMYAVTSGSGLWLLGFEGGKPFFLNRFDCITDEDIAYFTMSVWQKCGMDQLSDRLHIVADGDCTGLYGMLSEYVKETYVFRRNAGLSLHAGEDFVLPFDMESLFVEK